MIYPEFGVLENSPLDIGLPHHVNVREGFGQGHKPASNSRALGRHWQ